MLDRDRVTYDIPNSVGQMASTLRLFVYDSVTEAFVRQRWPGDGPAGDGELVGDAWLWTAPIE